MSLHYRLVFACVLFLYFSLAADAQHLVGYHHNWNDAGAPYIPLDQVDSRYTVINLSFPSTINGTDYEMSYTPCCGETEAGLIAKIQTLQAAGVKVNMSIGGATTPIHLDNATELNNFVSSMNAIINTYGLVGIDIDLEGSSLSVTAGTTIVNPTDANIVNMITAIQQIMSDYQTTYGKKMFLSSAPETAFVQGGQGNYSGIWGAYLPLLEALRPDMDLLHVQLYNSGSMFGLDGNVYSQSTADFIVSQVEAVIQGFTAAGGAGSFTGFAPDKVAVGLPACPSAAGGGFTSTTVVKSAIDYLRGTGSQPGTYTLQDGPYPSLGGMMTWSVNWDAVATCNSSSYEYASSYEDIFGGALCQKPELGVDLSACNLSFPYTLNSNTPIHPDVSFTWTNTGTGQTLVAASSTATTFDISQAGVYRVVRDSAGCSQSDEISILNDLPAPDMPASENLCAVLPYTLTPSNAAAIPAGTSYQWYKDNSLLQGETGSSLTGIRESGVYKLSLQNNACTSETTTTISSGAPTPIDACAAPGNTVNLAISTSETGPFSWYNSATGGTSLATGLNFTTPALASTTTYFVEDEGSVGNAVTGPSETANGLGTLQNFGQGSEITFDALTTFTLKEITLYPMVWCFTHTVSFEIQDASGTVLTNGAHSYSVTDDSDCSTPSGAVTFVLSGGGVQIPQGAGYKFVQTGSITFNHWQGGVTYPMDYAPYFQVTGVNSGSGYPALHDWKVEGGSCARLPVIAEIDPMCMSVLPVDLLSFSAVGDKETINLEWITAQEEYNKGFEVQRREKETEFRAIANLPAGGEEGQNFYSYSDADVRPGKAYFYRLRQEDLNGQFTFSEVRKAVLAPRAMPWLIYPTQAQDRLTFARTDYSNHTLILRIINTQGQVLKQMETSEQTTEISLSRLSPGMYYFFATDGSEREIFKFTLSE